MMPTNIQKVKFSVKFMALYPKNIYAIFKQVNLSFCFMSELMNTRSKLVISQSMVLSYIALYPNKYYVF